MVALSSNLVYERVHENLLTLGLTTVETMVDNWLSAASERDLSMLEVMDHLLEEEVAKRRTIAIETRTRLAGFPMKKSIQDFDLTVQKSIDRKMMNELCTLKFLHNVENLIFLGPPGVGKTHLAISLGMEAIKAGFSVYFINSAMLISRLKKAARQDNLERKLRTLSNRFKLLIIDEIGYLPFDHEAANLFFRLISTRYEKGSTIFTSNKSYGSWGEIFGDPVIASAVLDRILHHSITVNMKGESYRLRKRKRAGTPFTSLAEKEDRKG